MNKTLSSKYLILSLLPQPSLEFPSAKQRKPFSSNCKTRTEMCLWPPFTPAAAALPCPTPGHGLRPWLFHKGLPRRLQGTEPPAPTHPPGHSSGSGVAPVPLTNFTAATQPQHKQRTGLAHLSHCPLPLPFPLCTPHMGNPILSHRTGWLLPKPLLEPSFSLKQLQLTVSLFLKRYLAVVSTPPYQMPTNQNITSSSPRDPLRESLKHK